MKVLTIGTDINIFDKDSTVARRVREYGTLVDELHIIVLSGRLALSEVEGGRSAIQFADNVFVYPTNSRSVFLRSIDAYRIGKKLFLQHRFDVISTQDPAESGVVGAWLKRKFQTPLQVQFHADFLNSLFSKQSWKDWLRSYLVRYVIPRTSCFRVVSKLIADSLYSKFKIPYSRIFVLPIFVDVEKIKNAPITFNLHQKYPQFDYIILMVNRLTREKNITLAIDAFSKVVAQYPKIGSIIIGDGPERENLELRIKNLELQNSVILEGPCPPDTLVFYYKTADLFLLTSNYEGYGMVLVEAASAGCPIVSTNVGISSEIENATVVPVGDVDAIVKAIIKHKELGKMAPASTDASQGGPQLPPMPTYNEYLEAYKKSWQSCV